MTTSRDVAPAAGGLLRIGELSRRIGASPEVLRAWERRYGLFEPERSPGGFRLYTGLDQRRAGEMVARISEGLAPAEAARQILTSGAPGAGEDDFARLREHLEQLDGRAAGEVFDALAARMSIQSLIGHVVMPVMRDVGELWELGTTSVAQEHFFSNFFRRRLMALAEGWEVGERAVVLACAPEEQHDLPLICLGLALHARGWGITYLGPRTPAASLLEAAGRCDPGAIVLSCTVGDGLDDGLEAIADAPADAPLLLVGRAASPERARRVGSPEVPLRSPVAVARWIDEEGYGSRTGDPRRELSLEAGR